MLFDEGIIISTNNVFHEVKFCLSLVLGDNLGVNSIQGFSESFSANVVCRFCKINKASLKVSCAENVELLRTVENYSVDCAELNFQLSGIKEASIWNYVHNYHVIRNSSCDIMHDVFEGVCRYDMSHVILNFLDCKYF